VVVQLTARSVIQAWSRPGRSAGGLLLFLIAFVGLSAGCGGDESTSNAQVGQRTLSTKNAKAGDVEISVSPKRVTTRTGTLRIVLDTHSGELGIALPASASLTVGGAEWPATDFEGDGPGGHHREGTLHFRAGGPLEGTLRLTIRGLGEPVVLSWSLA
jgi:hypothetical protein